MSDKDNDQDSWRWDDLDSVFDDDFVEKAEFKEAGWKERREAAKQEKDARHEAKHARPTPGGRPDLTLVHSRPDRSRLLRRVAVIAVLVVLVVVGLGVDGFGPFQGISTSTTAATTDTTVAPTSTASTPTTASTASTASNATPSTAATPSSAPATAATAPG